MRIEGLDTCARLYRRRRFLLAELPAGFSVADAHSQITDNHLTGTRLYLRRVRVPQTRERFWKLMQEWSPAPTDPARTLVAEMYLDEREYETLSVFEGNEIRKNLYPFEHEGRLYTIEIFLGPLRGLALAETLFETDEELDAFKPPGFAHVEITREEIFNSARLVERTFEEIRQELARAAQRPPTLRPKL